MTRAECIVGILLQEEEGNEAAEFMRDVQFDAKGDLYAFQGLDIAKEELDTFSKAVIRRTAKLMPELVNRGICRYDNAHVVAQLLTFYFASLAYDPKLWHKEWQSRARKIFNYIRNHTGWRGSWGRVDLRSDSDQA